VAALLPRERDAIAMETAADAGSPLTGRNTTPRAASRALTEGTSATPMPLCTKLMTVYTCVASCDTRGVNPACWNASITIACRPGTRVEA
jgi:hypothetical protein